MAVSKETLESLIFANRHTAIRNLYATAVTIDDGLEAGKTVLDDSGDVVVVDEDAITAEVARLQAIYDGNEYQRNRAEEYKSWQDQLDDIYHNGIDAWIATVKVTKDKYPKP